MKFKVFAVDLDGTLFDSKQCVSDTNAEALRELESRGTVVAIATGRPPEVAEEILERVGIKKGGVVALNGAVVKLAGKELTHEAPLLPEGFGSKIKALADKSGAALHGFSQSLGLIYDEYNELNSLETFGGRISYQVIPFAGPADIGRMRKIVACGAPAALDALHASFDASEIAGSAEVARTLDWLMEFLPLGSSKSAGLLRLCRAAGADDSSLMAMGDGGNDIDMLKAAGFSVAMANGSDSAKNAADAVCEFTNDEDGVAAAVWKYALD